MVMVWSLVTAGRTATMCVILLFIHQVISDQMTLCLVDWIIVGTFDNHFDPVDEDSAFSEREILKAIEGFLMASYVLCLSEI